MKKRFEVIASDKNFITIQDNSTVDYYIITEDTIEDFLNKQNDKIAKLKKEIKEWKEYLAQSQEFCLSEQEKKNIAWTRVFELKELLEEKNKCIEELNTKAIERLERVRDYFANCLCNGAIAREKDISDIIDYLNKQINTLAKE